MMNFIRKRKVLSVGLAFIVLLPILFQFGPFLIPDPKWSPTPKTINGITVFDEHHPSHPGHFTVAEKIGISSKIDVAKLLFSERARQVSKDWPTFADRTETGEVTPDFDLMTTSGGRLKLSDLRGKYVAFMFVAITCPPARLETERWARLQAKYSADDVKLFVIYSREQHAGEWGYPDYQDTTTDEEKLAYAEELAALTPLDVAVDPITEDTLEAYGIVPNAAYVLNRDQKLVFKSSWSDSLKVETVLDTLLALEG